MLVKGTVIKGKYRVEKLIGEGGMNRVYLVEDDSGNFLAMKVTRAAGEVESEPGEIFEQFSREIAILTTLKHANLPVVIDHFTISDRHYIIEEYIDGISLEEYIKHRLPDDAQVTALGIAFCETLDYLHQHNVIFRDLKPANVIITGGSAIKLIDFDISRIYKADQKADTTSWP